MALVNVREMMKKAEQEHYAVGHFNINNLEWTKCILQVAEETVSEPVSEPEPVVPAADSAILNDVQPSSDVPVIDAMLDKHAWRTDMPGTAVKDIRSAISLNDRILFINFLFNEDPMSFQETLTKLNSMASFDEAATYMMTAFPHWDWESDTVYRFMMALRRRLQ